MTEVQCFKRIVGAVSNCQEEELNFCIISLIKMGLVNKVIKCFYRLSMLTSRIGRSITKSPSQSIQLSLKVVQKRTAQVIRFLLTGIGKGERTLS